MIQTHPIKCLNLARGEYLVAFPPKLFSFGMVPASVYSLQQQLMEKTVSNCNVVILVFSNYTVLPKVKHLTNMKHIYATGMMGISQA